MQAKLDWEKFRVSFKNMDDAVLLVYRWGVLAFSRVIGWSDRYLVDGVVNVVSAWTVSA